MKKYLSLVFIILMFTGCSAQVKAPPASLPVAATPIPLTLQPVEEKTTLLTVTAVGDIMAHQDQLRTAYDKNTGTYNFDGSFADLKPVFEASDLTIANLETTLAGKEARYSGYPTFNSPDTLAYSIKNAGIDWVSTANNHSLDKGEAGLRRTLQVLDKVGLVHTGTFATREDKQRVLIKEVKGIKIAFLAYTTSTNGIPLPKGKEYLVNNLNMQEIIQRVKEARAQGAELVIMSLHTGIEYRRQPTSEQETLAENLIKAGVDVILGSHPHVLEPVQKLKVYEGNSQREGLVIYSLGNFLSNQYLKYTYSGVVLNLSYEKKGNNPVKLKDINFIPTMVLRLDKDGEFIYRVLPVEKAIRDYEEKLDPGLYPKAYYQLKEVWSETNQLLTNQAEKILPKKI